MARHQAAPCLSPELWGQTLGKHAWEEGPSPGSPIPPPNFPERREQHGMGGAPVNKIKVAKKLRAGQGQFGALEGVQEGQAGPQRPSNTKARGPSSSVADTARQTGAGRSSAVQPGRSRQFGSGIPPSHPQGCQQAAAANICCRRDAVVRGHRQRARHICTSSIFIYKQQFPWTLFIP